MSEATRIGIRDIAKRCGVSAAAVSLVINDKARQHGLKEETIERIQRVIAECDYRPSLRGRLARTGRSRMVGLISETTFDEKWGEFYFELEKHLRGIGYYLITSSVPPGQDPYLTIDKFLDIPIDALVVRCPDDDVIRACAEQSIPLIALELVDRAPVVIKGNDEELGSLAARILIDGGAHQPALAFPKAIVQGDYERMAAFRAVFAKKQIEVHDIDCAVLDGDAAAADRAIHDFFAEVQGHSGRTIDAVFGHDRYCIALQTLLRRRAIGVPDAIQIIGCHDYTWSRYVDPPISTVAVDFTAIGERVFQHLRARLLEEAGCMPSSDLLTPTVRLRGSTRITAPSDRPGIP